MGFTEWVPLGLGCALAAFGAANDIRSGQIPNKLTLLGLLAGLSLGFVMGGIAGLLAAVSGAFIVALVPLLLFRVGAMGGGDVKLMAALGSFVGVESGLELETVAFFAGAVQGLFVWARNGKLRAGMLATVRLLVPVGRWGRGRDPDPERVARTTIRFGPAILIGAIAIIVQQGLSS